MKVTLKVKPGISPPVLKASVAVVAKRTIGALPKPASASSPVLASSGTSKIGSAHNQEVEMAAIGACLVEGSAIRIARNILRPEMFYGESHRLMFKLMCEASDAGEIVDIILLGDKLRASGKLSESGGMDYLVECTNKVVSAAHIEYYAKIIGSLHFEREIVKACKTLEQTQESAFVEKIRELVMLKESIKAPFMLQYHKDGLITFLDDLLAEKSGPVLLTGVKEIDCAWNGMKPGEINTWGAATNEGKSIMLLNLMHLSAKMGKRCLYVGTEMTAQETVQRHLALSSGIPAWKIRKPQLERSEIIKLTKVIGDELFKMQISILDDPEPSLERVESAIHSSKAEVVFFDYLERFEMPRAENLRLQIKEFMRRLKTLCRRHGVVGHLAAQLSRSTYGDVEKPPTMADLSESSAIEKESDRVILFWSPKKKQIPEPAGKGVRVIEAIQLKNRHGSRGQLYDFVLDEMHLKLSEKKDYDNPFNHTIKQGAGK